MRKILISIIAIALCSISFGNALWAIGSNDFNKRFSKVSELYENNMFAAACDEIELIRLEFPHLSRLEQSRLESYYVFCNIRMGSPTMDALVIELEDKFGPVPELAKAKLMQARHYFDQQHYSVVAEILGGVNEKFLSKEDKKDYLFQLSFSQLRTGQIKEAQKGFEELLKIKENKYILPATYYSGYIAYLNGDFNKALSFFEKNVSDDFYGPLSQLYMLESHLMLKNYDYVIQNGETVSNVVHPDMKSKVARMVSEAYFAMDKPQQAKEWFEQYSSSGRELSRKDNYYFGIISYSLDSYYAAIDAFDKVIASEDSLSQSSYFHIANSYLNLKNKHKALENYKVAAEMNIDAAIKEESYFNYAKLSFDLNSDIHPFNSYLELYPDSQRSDEIYSYIATSYLLSKNYKGAISALNNIKHIHPEMELNLQKAAFLRGMQLFEMGSYAGAIEEFKISLDHSLYNANLANLAKFWSAESNYWLDNFDESIKINKGLYNNTKFRTTKEYPLIFFNLGYAYFCKGEYQEALSWFELFIGQHYTNMDLILECEIRMADCYFMLKDYEKASSMYEQVSIVNYKSDLVVYAAYQCAVSYGLISNNSKKISILESIYGRDDKSLIYPKAVYELGRTYVIVGSDDRAEEIFTYMLEELDNPLYNSKALLELGMLEVNRSNHSKALDYLTQIVEKMPLSQETEDALAVIESIYLLKNKPDDYMAYLEKVGRSAEKDENDIELVYFNAAEQVFLSGDYQQSYKSLTSFLEKYPNGLKASLAHFYLAQTLSELGRKEAAANEYLEVVNSGEGSFVELSLLNYSNICYSMEKYAESANGYLSLYEVAKLGNNKYLAVLGMMRSNFHNEKYQSAIEAVSYLEDFPNKPENDIIEADYIAAKSYIALGQRDKALEIMKKLSEHKLLAYGAEATYILIQDTFDKGEFEEVENMVYAFSDSATNQMYWLAKSFIVLGDAFAELGDLEQAKATFTSIKDEYTPSSKEDDIIEQVNVRLERLEKIISEGIYNE